MADITTEQARIRFTTIPPALQDAIFSVQTAEIVGLVAEKYNIPEENIGDIAEAVGLVLLGFIHPEELAGEITARTGIAQQVAKDVSDSLATRIFNPLRDLLDRAYAPMPHEHEIPQPPRLVEEIKTIPVSPPSSRISEKNLGRQAGPPAPSSGSVGEFARLGIINTGEHRPASPELQRGEPDADSNRPSTSEEPPTMLHEETPIKPARQVSSFKIETPIQKLSDIKAAGGPSVQKPAVIDFGPPRSKKSAAKSEPRQQREFHPNDPNIPSKPATAPLIPINEKPSASTPRIVHYTEFRTPLAEKPPTDAGKQPAPAAKAPPPGIHMAENELPAGEHILSEKDETASKSNTPPAPPRPRIEPPEIRPPES